MSNNWFILTIPHADFLPYLPPGFDFIRGQLEEGEGGFVHWQVVIHSYKKVIKVLKTNCSVVQQPLRRRLAPQLMLSPLAPVQPSNMFGRSTPELRERNLSSVPDLWTEVSLRIGMQLDSTPRMGNWTVSQQMCMFEAISASKESLLIIVDLLQLKDKYLCFGESLAQASQEGPGMRPVWMLTQKIQTASFGMGTVIKNMLSVMSSVVQYQSVTYSDGSTGIQCWLKLKEAQQYLEQRRSGLLPISILETGTQSWIPVPEMLSSEGSPLPSSHLRIPTSRDYYNGFDNM